MSEPILMDAFEGWASGYGIFDKIMAVTTMPWAEDENATSDILDFEYFCNHSGAKFCSPLVKYLLEDGVVPSNKREKIAKIIVAKYLVPWTKLWATNELVYSPINNYDMSETRNLIGHQEGTETTDRDETETGTDTLTHGLVDTTEHGRTSDEVTYRYGMNNVVPQTKPSDEYTFEEGGETTVTKSGDDVQTKDLAKTDDATVTTDQDTSETEFTHRIGNIGVTTNQRLIQEERNLWIWNFFDQVFKDVDRELTLAISDPCRV